METEKVTEETLEGKRQARSFFLLRAGCFAAILLLAWLLSGFMRQAEAARLQQGISREVLRFHVLANSDSPKDQAVKLQVRDGVLEWLEEELTEEEMGDLSLMEKKIGQLLPQIQSLADRIVKENGMDYETRAQLGESLFPRKTYGNCTFPAGPYTALRLLLGKAEGQNWWCVLFPRLCFLDCVHAVVPEESQKQLQNVLTEEEYESLFDPMEDDYRIGFRYF